MATWTPFPHDATAYAMDADTLRQRWARLHAGDAEPLPTDAKVLAAWGHFHAGEFRKAVDAGLKAGGAGVNAANKAQCIHANYLESDEARKLALFLEAAQRAEARIAQAPEDPNGHYLLAYALGRYSQGISVAKALAQGLGTRVRTALETAIRLQPRHADAHIALGTFHAEVIDKVGKLLARTQGADGPTGLAMFKEALRLNPESAIARVEYANGLVMIEGEKKLKEATRLYEQAAAFEPADAMERLDVEMARAELED